MKILFHENELNYRGTSIALYDYADFNERYLGNESLIIFNKKMITNHPLGVEKFKKRFNVFGYSDFKEVDDYIHKNGIDIFYGIKNGEDLTVNTKACKSCIHTIFKHYQPHGDVYAYVSEWLSKEMSDGKYPYVPHMVNFETEIQDDLRAELAIPKTARVFGYHGGGQSFNLEFVQKTVESIAGKYKDIFFIFMGVDSFIKSKWWKSKKNNIIFLPPSTDVKRKQRFINTCNALLHGRERGETFGITVAEFAIKGKSIITFGNSPEKAHIAQLENQAYIYYNKKDLKDFILDSNLNITAQKQYEKFLPHPVMDRFKNVFID